MIGAERVTEKRILLADDQKEVREATNGREALELFKRETFDLLITDYAMPGMLGDELARRVKQLCPAQPVLMITGSIEACSLEKGCIDSLLNKPFTLDGLRQAVTVLLQPVA